VQEAFRPGLPAPRPHLANLWLNLVLLLVTLLTTTALGSRLDYNFRHSLPPFDLGSDFLVFVEMFHNPSILLDGLPYSLTLLGILLVHEMGHYLACLFYGIDASAPYFLPAPTFIGTFGAFIRFRSPVKSRRELFDVGFAGPAAGFAVLLPALAVGISLSKAVPGIGASGDLYLGTPLLLRLAEAYAFPGVPTQDIYLHPIARAAWVGLLATALNLLPIGQLDGGHLVYAMFGEKHRWISTACIASLVPLGFLYWPWWIWAAVFYILGRRHFVVVDSQKLGRVRARLMLVAALIFLLCFIPAPVLYNVERGYAALAPAPLPH